MIFRLKNVANRLVGSGPISVQPFDALHPALLSGAPNGGQTLDKVAGVLSTVPGDQFAYLRLKSLLGRPAESEALFAGKSADRRLFTLPDTCVAGGDGVVYDPKRRIAVEETVRSWFRPPSKHPLLAAPRFPAACPLPGVTLSLASLGAEGFYHFLIESLPRLALARPWLDCVDHVLAPGQAGRFQENWLSLAGVPREKIIWLEGHSHFRCEQLLFTGPLSEDSQPTPWLVSSVRDTVSAAPPERGTRKLWISRNDAGVRHIAWERELIARMPEFERVELASRPPAEQIALLGSAAVVVGPHGAGLANLIFCPTGASIVELQPAHCNRPLFGRLASAAGCRHAWTTVDFTRPPEDLPALANAIRAFAA